MAKKHVRCSCWYGRMSPVRCSASPSFTCGKIKNRPTNPLQSRREACYRCHDEIRDPSKEKSKHADLSCTTCHARLQEHLASYEDKPEPPFLIRICSAESAIKTNSAVSCQGRLRGPGPQGKGGANRSLADDGQAARPLWLYHRAQRATRPCLHGHRPVRGRPFCRRYVLSTRRAGSTWLPPARPGISWMTPARLLAETAKAGNPTCIQCKTSDHILKWKFLGDKDPKAKWDRTSDRHRRCQGHPTIPWDAFIAMTPTAPSRASSATR